MSSIVWDRTATSIATLAGDGVLRFAVLPSAGQSPIACGLSYGANAPNGIKAGFLVHGLQFCVVEDGQQVSDWMDCNVEALVLRAYRIGGRMVYTSSAAPASTYTATGWEDSIYAPDDEAHEFDHDPYASLTYLASANTTVRGDLVHEGRSLGGECVSVVAFARQAWDTYGEEVQAEIYGAMLVKLGEAGNALPALEGFGGDFEVFCDNSLPVLQGMAGSFANGYSSNYLPTLRGLGGDSVFAPSGNYSVNTLPPLQLMLDPAGRGNNLPRWVGKGGDGDRAINTLPSLQGTGGDGINSADNTLPMLVGVARYEFYEPGSEPYGAVPIFLGIQAQSVVTDPSHLPTQPLEFLLGVEGAPFGDNELKTQPLNLGLSIAGRVFAERTIEAEPFQFGLRLSGSNLFKERLLQTEPLSLAMGGDMQAQAEAILQTMPLVFALGGRLGAAAIGRVFCMNAATGGTTEYTGYAFNSVAKIGGRYYGANEQGLFLLEGETDNGTPIAANFGFGQLDFGAAQMKTLAYCYLGTQAGKMRLTVDALVDGKPAQYSYAARQHGASMRGIRFDLGRGMRSTYVMPTFSNVGGQDFEVDAVRFMATASSRRVQK